MKVSFFDKIKLFIEFALIVAVLFLLVRIAGEEERRNDPKSTYEEQFISIPSLQENIETFIGEQAPESVSYSYIPVYSHVYSKYDKPIPLVVMLSLRNADMKKVVNIHKILYYNTEGKLIREYFQDGVTLNPMETKEILIKKKDVEGGSGANFVVLFTMDDNSIPPLFESFMSGGKEDRGFSFSSRGTIFISPKKDFEQ